ncbi:signal peptidase I [Paenarthrobacter sp. CM16]|uniref:signal peptidase I n=1 Tax=Paenarthrobacter sp. CM16 TaxID=2738447 RepID=UPI0015558C58|nr:signal peptidase I [Paenarthrobacter sp. CM16]NQD88449.1 signal peptidase I [Paenarthrobacter sp. CM16]
MAPVTTQAARRRRRLLRSPWSHALLALILVALVQSFLVKIYHVPTGSMEQTLNVGDRVLVNRTAYLSAAPERGDVVVFSKPPSWGAAPERSVLRNSVGWFGELTGIGPGNTEYLVKRIIGVPGDTVECCDAAGAVKVNGAAMSEPYVHEDLPFHAGSLDCSTAVKSPRCFGALLLGEDQYLMVGDHRSSSEDSVAACRNPAAAADCVRTVHRGDITGRVDWRVFPFSKWGSPGS